MLTFVKYSTFAAASFLLFSLCNAQSNLEQPGRGLNSLKDLVDELNATVQTNVEITREGSAASIARGANLYRENCVQCHRDNAQGTPDWHKKDASGNYPPPPLNGTAHTWHHPKSLLLELIRDGSKIMPAFGATLSDEEITDIIHWFQSLWPDEVYSSWAQINQSYKESSY